MTDPTRLAAGAAAQPSAARLLVALAVVVLVTRLCGVLLARIGQPRVVGEIAGGLLLGPSALGAVAPGFTESLFPASVTGALRPLGQLGLVLFMLLVGMEVDLGAVRRHRRVALLVSNASVVLPLLLGVAAAQVVGPVLGGSGAAFALFLGAAMAVTAFPVLARIVTETGLSGHRLGSLALACAAVDDVTAWCLLGLVTAVAASTGPASALAMAAGAVALVAVAVVAVRPALGAVARRTGDGPAWSGLVVGAALASAAAAEWIGVHAIFGAFLLGTVLPRRADLLHRIHTDLSGVTDHLLLPVFFALTGLATSVGLLGSPREWAVAGLVLAVAIAGKLGGGFLAARACGETPRDAALLGVLLNARGVTEIVILEVGRDLGVVSPAVFTVMVLMALTTTVMTAPCVRRLYDGARRPQPAPRSAVADPADPALVSVWG